MKTILLADDEANLRVLVRTTLDDPDYTILEAADGTTALDLARQQCPDLLVLDWMMPGINGLDVARALREGHCQLNGNMVECRSRSGTLRSFRGHFEAISGMSAREDRWSIGVEWEAFCRLPIKLTMPKKGHHGNAAGTAFLPMVPPRHLLGR